MAINVADKWNRWTKYTFCRLIRLLRRRSFGARWAGHWFPAFLVRLARPENACAQFSLVSTFWAFAALPNISPESKSMQSVNQLYPKRMFALFTSNSYSRSKCLWRRTRSRRQSLNCFNWLLSAGDSIWRNIHAASQLSALKTKSNFDNSISHLLLSLLSLFLTSTARNNNELCNSVFFFLRHADEIVCVFAFSSRFVFWTRSDDCAAARRSERDGERGISQVHCPAEIFFHKFDGC